MVSTAIRPYNEFMVRRIILVLVFLIFSFSVVRATNAPDANNSSIAATTAGSDKVSADGVTKAYVTLTLKDSAGNPLSGDRVSLSITNDLSAVISPTEANLDGNGQAPFAITSTTAGIDTIDAIDRSQNITLKNLGTVTFYPPDCNAFAPGSAPKLSSAEIVSKSEIKLTWKKATDPVTNYAVSYGEKSEDYIYGATNIGNRDTTEYVVGNLVAGKTYYFVVRAANGCAPGPVSNELSASTSSGLSFSTNIIPASTPPQMVEEELSFETSPPAPTEMPNTPLPENLEVVSSRSFIMQFRKYAPIAFMIIGMLTGVIGFVFYLKSRRK